MTDRNFYEKGDGYFGGTLTAGGTITGADFTSSQGSIAHVSTATVARTDTSAKNLFTLPANAVITSIKIYGTVGSDAGTTATLVVGKTGTANAYMTSHNVKGAAGVGLVVAAETIVGTVGASAVQVTGTYAETGGAATTGGPFTVIVEYTTS